jgi:hypothetical protein
MVVGIGELLGAVDTIMPDCGGEVWESSRRSTGICRVAHVMEIPRRGLLPYGERNLSTLRIYYVDKSYKGCIVECFFSLIYFVLFKSMGISGMLS